MNLRPVKEWDERYIEYLSCNKRDENKQIEFRLKINKGDRKEIGETCCAFANTDGGFLVFGVADKRDIDNNDINLSRQIVGMTDRTMDRYIEIILDLFEEIKPQIPLDCWDLHDYDISIDPERAILVLQITRSSARPHRVVYKK